MRKRPELSPIIRTIYAGSVPAQCRRCGLGFLDPVPRADQVQGIYEAQYFREYADSGIPMPAEARTPPARYRARLAEVQRRTGVGRLLEVGPGTGAFLRYAKESGWEALGLEASAYAAREAAARLGIEVRCGTLLSAELPSAAFDVVHMSHVLEHFRDPIANLLEVNRVLKPGGAVIVEVPNEFHSLQFRVMTTLGVQQPYPVGSSHIFFFNPTSLRGMLERSGFSVSHLRSVRDLDGGAGIRTAARKVAAAVEQPLSLAPLIEAIGIK